MASGHDDNSHCETAVLPRHVESTYKSRSENKRQEPRGEWKKAKLRGLGEYASCIDHEIVQMISTWVYPQNEYRGVDILGITWVSIILAINRVLARYRQRPFRIQHRSKVQLINSYTIDVCHCSTLQERNFPRYPLPTILLYTTSATSSRLSSLLSSFLSRLLTAVCQPSTLPYFSRVLVRSGATRAAGGGSGGGWIRAAAPTDAYESTYTGGFRRTGRYFGEQPLPPGLSVFKQNRGGPFPSSKILWNLI
ncbi:hypothetical protein G5I_14343 [Acromyrmex echinatior]|uniref:Uncharacterized protein n=1 Tax=Acromyrmex echinatior TaxID=103372 RepID=F4X7G4_ACREC|nr:hypothetical protein G5I_14343 [Acromyrmex echinatior]